MKKIKELCCKPFISTKETFCWTQLRLMDSKDRNNPRDNNLVSWWECKLVVAGDPIPMILTYCFTW